MCSSENPISINTSLVSNMDSVNVLEFQFTNVFFGENSISMNTSSVSDMDLVNMPVYQYGVSTSA